MHLLFPILPIPPNAHGILLDNIFTRSVTRFMDPSVLLDAAEWLILGIGLVVLTIMAISLLKRQGIFTPTVSASILRTGFRK